MVEQVKNDEVISFKCLCGQELQLEPQLLGRIVPCPQCRRCLRVGLQFLLVEESLAPNITVICRCGRFIVESPRMIGKPVKCKVCGQQFMLPEPVDRPSLAPVVRVPPRALQKHLHSAQGTIAKHADPSESQLYTAARSGRITLRPGQQFCANPKCSAMLPSGGNVCPYCGTNVKTKTHHVGSGPEADPVGKWKPLSK
jgi:hypothetical protein